MRRTQTHSFERTPSIVGALLFIGCLTPLHELGRAIGSMFPANLKLLIVQFVVVNEKRLDVVEANSSLLLNRNIGPRREARS
jgi:hypothetical protein